MLPDPFLVPVHPGGAEPDLCLACLSVWCHLSGGHVASLPRSFILLPRNPVIPGQLLLMRRGNEQRFSWGGGEERTEIIGSLKLEKMEICFQGNRMGMK